MRIQIDINDEYEDTPQIVIQAKEWTEELEQLLRVIKSKPNRLFGIDGEQTILLDPTTIEYVFTENRKTFAATSDRRLEIKMKLYEVEKLLAADQFMRFSKSVIGNLNQISRFELSFNGNLCVYFRSGNKEYISRKYVAAIKQQLLSGGSPL
jgi:DNA-binding LytR/AlgR family response regulator